MTVLFEAVLDELVAALSGDTVAALANRYGLEMQHLVHIELYHVEHWY